MVNERLSGLGKLGRLMHPQAMARGAARANRAASGIEAIVLRTCARASMPRTLARKFANGTAMAGSFATKKAGERRQAP